MNQKLIARGAEAKIYSAGGTIIKSRIRKSYRLKELDERLRGFRTRREAKVLQKLHEINFCSPSLIKSDDKENLVMENVRGKLLKNELKESNCKKLCTKIGEKIAMLHNNSIIHGDLTTSNMILGDEIYFIDFGLSFFSDKNEDKAVDLHVLKEGLESKHYKICAPCFREAITAYRKNAKSGAEILKRLQDVEKRGRYRAKKGN